MTPRRAITGFGLLLSTLLAFDYLDRIMETGALGAAPIAGRVEMEIGFSLVLACLLCDDRQ